MIRHLFFIACIASATHHASAADLPPDKGNEIPESGKRPVVVTGKATLALPKHDLPEGYTLSVAAASPLVTHPIMGCLDDKGRLFVGDGVGVNWNKKQLEENPPNRVLMLEDTDKDGAFDKSTVFADKMTFPQGACWLNGSLYVCSPPGLWKLTDTNKDGVADKREMIVSGFDYTGNAADVHGPFLHPNGRLYWCHGRKGHKVIGKEGEVVHEGLACGIWSCKPDGSDVAWHSLGCGDNPVEVDFTPEGDIIGVQNLYYSQPRGDTIVHWLYGGVYERADQLKAIEGLPRTLEHMPVMYNFGHVAVSGSCFWRSYPTRNQEPGTQNFLVTHFNTQRVVRMELTPDGGTYKAVENEFLRLPDAPDVHFTDVMEDPRDGSLLVIDTGGWFRIGCPSSLMAKSDLLGAIYRVKPAKATPVIASKRKKAAAPTLKSQMANLSSTDAHVRRRALEWINMNVDFENAHGEQISAINEKLMPLMSLKLDPASEHALIAVTHNLFTVSYQDVKAAENADPVTLRHLIQCFTADDSASANLTLAIAKTHLDSTDADLARVALTYVIDHPDADEWVMPDLGEWLKDKQVSALRLKALTNLGTALIAKPETQKLITTMLTHAAADVRGTALGILAAQTAGTTNDAWLPALDKLLTDSPTPLLFDAIKKLKSAHFDAALQAIAANAKRPLSIRLKALDSAKGVKLTGDTFAMVKGVLGDAASSAAARIQAATMIASALLDKEQQTTIAPLLATVGPVELDKLLPLLRKPKDADMARTFATELAKNPAIASQQESIYRTALADKPVDIFETIILPAYNKAVAATEAKKRMLPALSEKVTAKGDAAAGRKHFEMGKGTCIACHKIGEVGRPIGPDLSKIGSIRTERDLLESILFPSNTLARDYEAHIIETSDGQSTMGVIKSHTAEGLLVIDIAGQEKTVAHTAITGDTTLTTSLMPMGLDQTLPEQEMLDLVAWLRSLK